MSGMHVQICPPVSVRGVSGGGVSGAARSRAPRRVVPQQPRRTGVALAGPQQTRGLRLHRVEDPRLIYIHRQTQTDTYTYSKSAHMTIDRRSITTVVIQESLDESVIVWYTLMVLSAATEMNTGSPSRKLTRPMQPAAHSKQTRLV